MTKREQSTNKKHTHRESEKEREPKASILVTNLYTVILLGDRGCLDTCYCEQSAFH